MKTILLWTLKMQRMSIMWWTLGAAALAGMNLAFYPSFKQQAAELEKALSQLPKGLIEVFAGSNDLVSPVGFLNSQIFYLMMPILFCVFAILLGSGLIAKEEKDRTLQLLLARPVSRMSVAAARALAGLILVGIVAGITTAMVLVVNHFAGVEVSAANVLLAFVMVYVFAVTCGAVAFTLTMVGVERGASAGLAAVVGLGGYLMSSLSGQVEALKWPSKILPYAHYQSEAILRGTYDWLNVLYFIGFLAAAAAISWLTFRRRDLTT